MDLMSDVNNASPTVPTTSATPNESHEAFARVFGNGDSVVSPTPVVSDKSRRMKRFLITFAALFSIVLLVAGILGFLGYSKAMALKSRLDEVELVGKEAYDALKTQNLVATDQKLVELRVKFDAFASEYRTLFWLRGIPVLASYYQDGTHGIAAGYAGLDAAQTLVKAVEPYADVLGFQGQGSFNGGSAEERIVKLIETLDKVIPSLDSVTKDLEIVNNELNKINEAKYPEEFRGTKVKSTLVQAKSMVSGAVVTIKQARPMIEVLPQIAGGTSRKKYLVIFQNSGELRPTGGFMTGYAILNVDKGKIEAEASGDIYDLDAKFRNKPVIPPILKRFLTTETRFNLRDMNISPDFKVSMDTFYENYEKVPGQPQNFDGIIGVDTHFLSSLVGVLGPVEVPGFGTFSAENDKRCDCPQIIYALSEIVDRPTNYIRVNRKGILGPMMKSILTKAYSAPKEIWPNLFTTGWKNIEGKHIQLYFFEPKAQAAAEAINAAGRVSPGTPGSDYFLVVDTNLAGAKSNFFVKQNIEHVVDLPQNGEVKHTVTITYENPFAPSNCNLEAGQLCLNGRLNDWVRFYLPSGAKFIESRGFDEGSVKETDDLGHRVVEGVFALQPRARAKIELTYTVPYTDNRTYRIEVQRQGGIEDVKHTFVVNGQDHEVILTKDQKFEFGF